MIACMAAQGARLVKEDRGLIARQAHIGRQTAFGLGQVNIAPGGAA